MKHQVDVIRIACTKQTWKVMGCEQAPLDVFHWTRYRCYYLLRNQMGRAFPARWRWLRWIND